MKFKIFFSDLSKEAQDNYDKALEKQGYASDTKDEKLPISVIEIEPNLH